MLAADPLPPAPRFRLWVRRQAVAEGPFSVRFEVFDGKGILRVARPGVLIDPPARPIGFEERLTTGQLRSSRFLLVWDGGRARQGFLLGRIDENVADRLELDRWVELETFVEGGFRYLVLGAAFTPAPAPRADAVRRPSLSELRQALDSMTVADEELVDDPDSALDALTGGTGLPPRPPAPAPKAVLPPVDETPVVTSPVPTVAAPSTHVVRLGEAPSRPATPLLPDDDEEMLEAGEASEEEMLEAGEAEMLEAGEAEGEEEGGAGWSSVFAAGSGVDDDDMAAFAIDTAATRLSTEHVMRGGIVEEAVTFFPGAAEEVIETPPATPPAPGAVEEDLHRNSTTLVRHLRRRLVEADGRVAELEARIEELESMLARRRAEG